MFVEMEDGAFTWLSSFTHYGFALVIGRGGKKHSAINSALTLTLDKLFVPLNRKNGKLEKNQNTCCLKRIPEVGGKETVLLNVLITAK